MRRFYTVMTAVALTVATVFSGVSTVQAGGYHEYDVEKYVMNQLSAASGQGSAYRSSAIKKKFTALRSVWMARHSLIMC